MISLSPRWPGTEVVHERDSHWIGERRINLMKKNKSIFLVFFFLAIFPDCSNGSTLNEVSSLIPSKLIYYSNGPLSNEDIWCAIVSKYKWRVKNKNGQLKVIPFERFQTKRQKIIIPYSLKMRFNGLKLFSGGGNSGSTPSKVLQTKDGWFVGFDFGEWGGSLWWFSTDGHTQKKLSDDNVLDLIETKSGITAIVGLCHMDCANGKFLRVEKVRGNWECRVIVDMKSAPRAWLTEKEDTYLVITQKTVLRVHGSGGIQKLSLDQTELPHPNSVVELESGKIVIGMNHFVLVLAPEGSGYKEYWFSPADCPHFADQVGRIGSKCKCLDK